MSLTQALRCCEQYGIVVLDEVDKICQPSDGSRKGVSGEGVQQDLLPLVEGTTVNLKSGMPVKTDHILFIASGAFQLVKPSDMIAELQGRMPLRVNLKVCHATGAHPCHALTRPQACAYVDQRALAEPQQSTIADPIHGRHCVAGSKKEAEQKRAALLSVHSFVHCLAA